MRGWAAFDDSDQHEARRLLDLRYRLSAMVADEYAGAGFTTVVQDNIYGADVVEWLGSVRSRPLHLVVLRPPIEVVASRDESRRRDTGKVAALTAGNLDVARINGEWKITNFVGSTTELAI